MIAEKYAVVGMMSGTSMDGMDLVLCHFIREQRTNGISILKRR